MLNKVGGFIDLAARLVKLNPTRGTTYEIDNKFDKMDTRAEW